MTQIICLDINDNIFGLDMLSKAIFILGYLILPKGGRFPPVFPHCDVINFFVRIEDNVENVEAEDELFVNPGNF